MSRLRDRFQLSPQARDRLGILCACGAVACVASCMARWSYELPVERSAWEEQLFGDLAAVDDQRQKLPAPQVATHVDARPLEEIARPAEDSPVPFDLAAESPANKSNEPASHAHRRFIQPVHHQQSAPTPLVWLSGAIEIPEDVDAAHDDTAETQQNQPAPFE